MKLRILKCNARARRGVISEFDRLPNAIIETPGLLLCTQGGLVPHLIPDVLHLLSPKPSAVLLPLAHLAVLHERLKNNPIDIAQYVGLPHLVNFVTAMDPLRPRVPGFHKTDILAVHARSGKVEYDTTSYMDLIGHLKPDLFMTLCDGDTTKESSRKRTDKSMSRSRTMLKQCLIHMQETSSPITTMAVPLEGGMDTRLRKKYSRDVSEVMLEHGKGVRAAGVVIDGLGQFGDEVALRKVADYASCISASLEECDIDGFRMVPGAWHPSALFELIDLGIDLFDSSYPSLVTERGGALLLPTFLDQPLSSNAPLNYEISLKDPANAKLFEPLMESCKCHCCRNHTRAYIHHLLNVNEMLASVLLNIHNQQQYLQLFEAIRQSLDNNTFHLLKANFTQ